MGCIAAISAALHLFIGLNNDTLTLMHQTKKMLDGAIPYVEYIDINPPLVNLIFSMPLLFARVTGIELFVALNLFALAIGALSLLVSAKLLAGHAQRLVILVALAVGLFSLSFMHQLFADREYLMVALIMPLLVLYSPLLARENIPGRWRDVAALMAGIGFALKPYALALYAAALLYRVLSGESWRRLLCVREIYIIGVLGVAYIAVTAIWFSEYFRSILPIASQTYGVIQWDFNAKLDIISGQFFGHYGAPGLLACAILLIVLPVFCPVVTYLLLLMAGACGAYVLSAGWYYTQYPFIVVAWLLLCAAGVRLLEACAGIADRQRRRLAAAVTVACLLVAAWGNYAASVLTQLSWDLALMRDVGRPMMVTVMTPQAAEKINAELNAQPRFLFLSFSVWAPALLDGAGRRESVGRFDYLWPLPGVLQQSKRGGASYGELMDWFAGGIADDLERKKPDLIIADDSPEKYFLPRGFHIIDFLVTHPRFARALEAYQPAGVVDSCNKDMRSNCAYTLYRKKTDN